MVSHCQGLTLTRLSPYVGPPKGTLVVSPFDIKQYYYYIILYYTIPLLYYTILLLYYYYIITILYYIITIL
jgi:hypothetical protein